MSEENLNTVNRYDVLKLDNLGLKETTEGYLEGFSITTRTGVFEYARSDGTIQRELRTPEEVFSEETIKSFKLLPMTNNHPDDSVNSENVKAYNIGVTGESLKIDDSFLATYLKILDKDTIRNVKDGKRGLSWGYSVALKEESGVYKGERYDYIQTNIRGNHLAVVDQGRAGKKARLKLDSNDAMCVFNNFNNNNNNLKMKKYKLDGKEFEVSEEVFSRLDALETLNSSLENTNKEFSKKIDSLVAESETLKGEKDAMINELKEKNDSDEVSQKVKDRIRLENKCREFFKNDEDLSSYSDLELKSKVISITTPDFKSDGHSEEYVSARFDVTLELKKDSKLQDNFKAASNKDSKTEKLYLSNEDLQANLISRSTSNNK